MSTSTETTKADEPSLSKVTLDLVRYYLGGRKGLILLTLIALGAGMFFNWGWLVAVGVAPLLLALAPCAAMCALGLCMNKMGGKSGSTGTSPDVQNAKINPASPPAPKVHDEA